MPYVKKEIRPTLPKKGMVAGELNYTISKLCDEVIIERGLSYATINEIIGVLECAKLELYRRVAADYEDTKISENGDVYECLVEE